MNIFRNSETPERPVDVHSFVGPATTKLLASSQAGVALHVYRVSFESGGRTNWHTHAGPQLLLVIDGAIRVQCAGHDAVDVAAGDAIIVDSGEKHWHGAVPGHRGIHLAVNVNATTEWLEPVSDADYGHHELGA